MSAHMPWRVAEFWSSANPGKTCLMLAKDEQELATWGLRGDFVRWHSPDPLAAPVKECLTTGIDTPEFCRILGDWAYKNSVVPDNNKRYSTVINYINAHTARAVAAANKEGYRNGCNDMQKAAEEMIKELTGRAERADTAALATPPASAQAACKCDPEGKHGLAVSVQAVAPAQVEQDPVAWLEAEESARGQDPKDVLWKNSMLYSTRICFVKPAGANPVWPLYTRPQAAQAAAQVVGQGLTDAELLEQECKGAQGLAFLLRKEKDRFEFLHSTNIDAEGWEWGVARIRATAAGGIEYLWGVSDHSDIDRAILAAQSAPVVGGE